MSRVFLSHSSADKSLVASVASSLGGDVAWIDTAEIEWGDIFLERIEEGIRESAHFVLFWSQAASKSEWVRLETHMGFIRALRDKALRFAVVRLDDTQIPLRLEPFQFLDVSSLSSHARAPRVVEALRSFISTSVSPVRHRFVNRNSEIARIETAIDSGLRSLLIVRGFQGVGKRSLVSEALSRLYRGSEAITIRATDSTSWTEFALSLGAVTGSEDTVY